MKVTHMILLGLASAVSVKQKDDSEIAGITANSDPKPAPVLTAQNDHATMMKDARRVQGKKLPNSADGSIAPTLAEKKEATTPEEADKDRQEYVHDMKNSLARHMELPPYENVGNTARLAGGNAPEVSPDEKKAKPEVTVQTGGFQLDQRFRLVSKRQGQKAVAYDPVPINKWDLVNTSQFNLKLEDQDFKGGEYFLWNNNSETIRAFSNSSFTLSADDKKNAIIEPFKNDIKNNQIEYLKETSQVKNFKNNLCLTAQKDDSLDFAACKKDDIDQQFYPLYTYQVQGSVHWHSLENE
jgi:hypothetical protein